MTVFFWRIALLTLLLLGNPVFANDRVALVVGNSEYAYSPLTNPVNDAKDVAEKLSSLGFSVDLQLNASFSTMKESIKEFSKKSKSASLRLFYFAGHGIGHSGINYLMPVNANIEEQDDLEFEAIGADSVLKRMEGAGGGSNIVILDACRNNPLPSSARSSSRGLQRMKSPVGSLIIYATAPGELASDGTGKNGTFTKHLLNSLGTPGVHLNDLLMDVRVAVMKETDNKQVPWTESSLTERVYLAGTGETGIDSQVPEASPPSEEIEAPTQEEYESEIVVAYRKAAEAGDAVAQLQLGYLYDSARYVARDLSKARHWYESSAEQGNLDAVINLGVLHYRGIDGAPDYERAMQYFQQAANGGRHEAYRNLAVHYMNGKGVNQDYLQAMEYYRQAFAKGSAEAAAGIGDLYSYGLGVEANPVKAVAWYREASNRGSASGQSELGYHYLEGIGVSRDLDQAYYWFDKSAEQLFPPAVYNLAEMYELGKGVNKNEKRAIELYRIAEKHGVKEATAALARLR